MSADGRQFILPLADELIVDLFAGGGGMSSAIEQAMGRHVDIAANHDDDATSMHRMNHPQTRHFIADVFEVDPRGATRGKPVGLLHLSPDCTHFSQAKGGQTRDKKIRGLSWVGKRWAGQVAPRIITLENVKQIRDWGPLVAKRDPATGRVVKIDGTVAARGERVPVQQQFLVPDHKHKGRTWKRFIGLLQGLGYAVEHRILCAADFGAPTTRERLFLVARRDGEPIHWPAPTHFKKPAKGQQRWRSAAECIDWSIPCPSIFDRKKALVEATNRRVARGTFRYVLNTADPFIVNVANSKTTGRGPNAWSADEPVRTVTTAGGFYVAGPQVVPATHHGGDRGRGIGEPLPTITAAHRGEQMLVAPTLLKIRGTNAGGTLELPLPTITSGAGAARPAGAAHAMGIVAAHLQQMTQGGREHDASEPLKTITTAKGGEQALIAASLIQAAHGERRPTEQRGPMDLGQPISTLHAGGNSVAAVACHLQRQFGASVGSDLGEPVGAITAGGGGKTAQVAAFLAQMNNHRGTVPSDGRSAADPLSTLTAAGSQQQVVAAHLAHLRGNCDARSVEEPLRTLSAGGEHHAVVEYTLSPEHEAGALRVAAFLMRYYGEGGQWGDLRDPAQTITTKDRLALVTVWIKGYPYVIVDIGLRMLTPRELYRAQGFPDDYIIDRGHDGRVFSKSAQVRMVGNSVSPPPAIALLRANFAQQTARRRTRGERQRRVA